MEEGQNDAELVYPSIPFMPVDKDGFPLKTVDEICIEVDQVDTNVALRDLLSYVKTHARSYPVIYLQFIHDHFKEKGQFLNEHKSMFNNPFDR